MNCNSELLITVLDKFSNLGLIELVNTSCTNITITDMCSIRLTMFILLRPEVQTTINSLSFSNLLIVNIVANKKQNGISFVKTLESVKIE